MATAADISVLCTERATESSRGEPSRGVIQDSGSICMARLRENTGESKRQEDEMKREEIARARDKINAVETCIDTSASHDEWQMLIFIL